jgi:hypothetical protein
MDFDLIPRETLLEKNGFGTAVDVRASKTRTFFCVMEITDQIEQESVDISIWGSTEGEYWGVHPLLKLPQQFYRGETRAVLDLALVPEINFIRAGWVLTRWGRVTPHSIFRLGLNLTEIPAMSVRVSPVAATAATNTKI